ncbi:SMP-30/gluconolactonase/LRE family protein [Streptomyces shenzhenensis]|uniref:SMP-30/gluconolactonase/LRE family protein n=1 Tax=Streptomyces shenzhenensis TaxID=943815 RepID=UPI003687E025
MTVPPDPSITSSGCSPEVFATCEEGRPDGTVTDAEGALGCAGRGTGTVRRHLPDGTLDRVPRLPAGRSAGAVCSVPAEAPGTPTPPVRRGPGARSTPSSVRERA